MFRATVRRCHIAILTAFETATLSMRARGRRTEFISVVIVNHSLLSHVLNSQRRTRRTGVSQLPRAALFFEAFTEVNHLSTPSGTWTRRHGPSTLQLRNDAVECFGLGALVVPCGTTCRRAPARWPARVRRASATRQPPRRPDIRNQASSGIAKAYSRWTLWPKLKTQTSMAPLDPPLSFPWPPILPTTGA